jgi:nickel-dependent lactate racemase
MALEGIRIPWNAWYGDEEYLLTFPKEWEVKVVPMRDAPNIDDEAIKEAFCSPIGTPALREMAAGRKDAVIAVDDITRPTPASRVLPPIIQGLNEAGMPTEKIKIIIAIGEGHKPHLRIDNLLKLGKDVVDQIEVMNHLAWGGTYAYVGTSFRGTPVYVNRFFAEADVKIGVGCIMPHASAGYGGGGKIIVPGLADRKTIELNHRPAEEGKTGGLGIIESNVFRREIEEMAKMAGLEFIANVVVNSKREIAGVFLGDPVLAHREGVKLARNVCATPDVPKEMDVVVINAYPKDMNLGRQAGNAFNVLFSATKRVVREGGTIVMPCACADGPGYDKAFYRFHRWQDYPKWRLAMDGRQMVVFSPNVSLPDVRGVFPEDTMLFADWDELIAALRTRHSKGAQVAVFPCAALQLAED